MQIPPGLMFVGSVERVLEEVATCARLPPPQLPVGRNKPLPAQLGGFIEKERFIGPRIAEPYPARGRRVVALPDFWIGGGGLMVAEINWRRRFRR